MRHINDPDIEQRKQLIKKNKIIAYCEIISGIGIIIFWVQFFMTPTGAMSSIPCYLIFEWSFPVPDLVLAIELLLGGALLLRNNKIGLSISLLASGGLIFLGLIDISFNLKNGIYTYDFSEGIKELFINLWCLVVGGSVFFVIGGQRLTFD